MTEHVNPKEPTGLGAVVETEEGEILIRYSTGALAPWIAAEPEDTQRPYRYYADHEIRRVLFGGVYR